MRSANARPRKRKKSPAGRRVRGGGGFPSLILYSLTRAFSLQGHGLLPPEGPRTLRSSPRSSDSTRSDSVRFRASFFLPLPLPPLGGPMALEGLKKAVNHTNANYYKNN